MSGGRRQVIGKPVKSGLQIKTEQAIIDGTNRDGFLHKSKTAHLHNHTVLNKLLQLWGYVPKYDGRTNSMTGWQIASKQNHVSGH